MSHFKRVEKTGRIERGLPIMFVKDNLMLVTRVDMDYFSFCSHAPDRCEAKYSNKAFKEFVYSPPS